MIERDVVGARLGVDGAKVLVLGLGVAGRSAARVLAAAGASVLASDESDVAPDVVRDLDAAGVDVETRSHVRARGTLTDVDFILPSPGIPPHRGLLSDAIARGVPIATELDLAQRLTDAPVVGVTGTNGKTTVVRLAAGIARAAGLDAHACGNIGRPFIEAAAEHPSADLFVVECSSFQLRFADGFHPHVAVITNLAPDHLDWHGSIADYRAAKANIAARQGAGDLFLYPDAQPDLASLAPAAGPARAAFGIGPVAGGVGAWVDGDEVVVTLPGRELRAAGATVLAARGPHFAEDAAAAAGALAFCGASAAAVADALTSFEFDPHRLELVGTRDGVDFYDDSKATNPHAAVASIRRFPSVVLVCGGRNKGLDLGPLAGESVRLRAVVTMGEAAAEIEDVFAPTNVPVHRAGSMDEAVGRAASAAAAGDVVLLAPACTSWDAYGSYAERGRDFQRACRSLGISM